MKKFDLAPKGNLDPAKYGTFTREQFAFFFAYEYVDAKGRTAVRFDAVPVRIASNISSGNTAFLEMYARECATADGVSFVKLLKCRIPKYQKIEIGGNQFYVTGFKEARNARQFAFSLEETSIATRVIEGEDVADASIMKLYDGLVSKFHRFAPKLGTLLGVDKDKYRTAFQSLTVSEKRLVLLALLNSASGKNNMVDLTLVGGVSNAGCIKLTYSKELLKDDFYFVDTSVTGMFERRYQIEL